VARLAKRRLVQRLEHQPYGFLHHPVHHATSPCGAPSLQTSDDRRQAHNERKPM
jgi:hypothetical protein